MTNQNIANALTFGFLAFIFLAIQAPAQAEDCPPGTKLNPMGKCTWVGGWGGPSGPNMECPPGYKPTKNWTGTWQCAQRPVKQIGKTNTQAACEAHEGNRWDQQAGRCIKSTAWEDKPAALKSALKRQCAAEGGQIDEQTGQCITSGGVGGGGSAQDDCESKGANYRYDPQTGSCIKTISKKAPVTSGECQLCSSKGNCSPAGSAAECAQRKTTAEKMTVEPFLKWNCTCSGQ